MTKTTSTKPAGEKSRPRMHTPSVPVLIWDVTLPCPPRRWWITAVQITGILWFGILLTMLQQYGFAAAILLGYTAWFLTRQRKDETHRYSLRGSSLREDGKEIDLGAFKAFRLVELPDNSDERLSAALVLAPKRFIAFGRTIYLPGDVDAAVQVMDVLQLHLRMRSDAELDAINKVVNRMARWMRLG